MLKKADDSLGVTPGSDSLTLTNTERIAKSWKYQTNAVVLPDGKTVTMFTRGGTNNAFAEHYNISLDKAGGWKAYNDGDQVGNGHWVVTSNEIKIVYDSIETDTITQLTYYHWDDKFIYDPSTTIGNYVVDEARNQKIYVSKGATFIFKMSPS